MADKDAIKAKWIDEQLSLKEKLIEFDSEQWQLTNPLGLQYVGGVDISFVKDSDVDACASFVVMDIHSSQVVYESFMHISLVMPYISGFLAFREVDALVQLVNEQKERFPDIIPSVILVDGNGILHPRGFGLACHLGVLLDIPTIGIGKNFLHVDGLTKDSVKDIIKLDNPTNECGEETHSVPIIGNSGKTLAMAFHATSNIRNPIFVSVGHKISLETSIKVLGLCSLHRIPEPVRQADLRSREIIRNWLSSGIDISFKKFNRLDVR